MSYIVWDLSFVPCKVVFEEASEGRADMLSAKVYLLSLEVSCLHRLYVFTCWREFTFRQGVYRLNTIMSVRERISDLRVHSRRQNAKSNVIAICFFFLCRYLCRCTIFQRLLWPVLFLLVLSLSHSPSILSQCDGPFNTCSYQTTAVVKEMWTLRIWTFHYQRKKETSFRIDLKTRLSWVWMTLTFIK